MISANVSVFSIGKAVGRGGAGSVPFSASWAVVAGGGGGGTGATLAVRVQEECLKELLQ